MGHIKHESQRLRQLFFFTLYYTYPHCTNYRIHEVLYIVTYIIYTSKSPSTNWNISCCYFLCCPIVTLNCVLITCPFNLRWQGFRFCHGLFLLFQERCHVYNWQQTNSSTSKPSKLYNYKQTWKHRSSRNNQKYSSKNRKALNLFIRQEQHLFRTQPTNKLKLNLKIKYWNVINGQVMLV